MGRLKVARTVAVRDPLYVPPTGTMLCARDTPETLRPPRTRKCTAFMNVVTAFIAYLTRGAVLLVSLMVSTSRSAVIGI